jgi:hypothetical protein
MISPVCATYAAAGEMDGIAACWCWYPLHHRLIYFVEKFPEKARMTKYFLIFERAIALNVLLRGALVDTFRPAWVVQLST